MLGSEPQAPSPEGRADFDVVFRNHYGFVRRGLRSMGVGPDGVDDAAQEVFVVFHRRQADFDPSRDVRHWLWGIARRVAATQARTRARAVRRLAVAPTPEPGPTMDEHLARQEAAERVARLLDKIPPKQREVFVLIEIESLAAPDVAEALGLKLNTVYSRLRLAREKFTEAAARMRAREERRS